MSLKDLPAQCRTGGNNWFQVQEATRGPWPGQPAVVIHNVSSSAAETCGLVDEKRE